MDCTCTDCNELVPYCTCGPSRVERKVFLPAPDTRDAEIFHLRNEVAQLRKALQDIANGAAGGATAIRALSARY